LALPWIKVTDETTARRAVKMAGLPLLLVGAHLLFSGYVLYEVLGHTTGMMTYPSVLATGGSICVAIALLLRAGLAWLVPLATLIVVPLVALQALTLSIFFFILSILALPFLASGVMGWLWLRRNDG
jgi:hypothetical protein